MSTEDRPTGCFRMKIIEYHDCKTLLGPCFISFSIPLLVPGVVLTVVGSYGNQNTFPTFGAWHIVGIVFLIFSVLFLVFGIILKCVCKPIISIDIERHLTPNSSMITGNKNLGYEEDIYCSTNNKLNKISHHDSGDKHRVISTHESKTTTNKTSERQSVVNGAKTTVHGSSVKENSGKPDYQRAQPNNYANTTNSSNVDRKSIPKSYEDEAPKNKQKRRTEPIEISEHNTSSSAVKTMQGQVKVTASIVAEAETTQLSESRDGDIKANEQSTFLPEVKRKKKKKRKHRRESDLSQASFTDETDSALAATSRQVLPELRAPPVLITDSSHHHQHDNLHVHFQGEPDKLEYDQSTVPEHIYEEKNIDRDPPDVVYSE